MQIERLGPYQVIRELGRGGMGTVFEAVSVHGGEPVAIKLLSALFAQDADFRARFEAEIETLRKLKHPNIVRLYGYGEQDGHLFFAMELVDGQSLEEQLRQGRPFDWREVTRIGIEVCQALRHAHDRGIIHRDIKPGNLLLAADGHVKLSDFGIARLFGNTRMTQVGGVLGTAEYMAPEQADGQPVGPRSDLYSLGGVLYVLLTRRPLFRGKSAAEVLQKHRSEVPEPVRQYAPDCPAELEQIIAQLLEKSPERRIANAAVLARRLQAMEHALRLTSETAPGQPVAGESGEQDDRSSQVLDEADLPARPDAAALPEAEQAAALLPTQVSTAEPPAPEPPDEWSETMPATGVSAAEGSAAAPRQSVDHFTPVKQGELDRSPLEAERRATVLIAPRTWLLVAALLAVGLGAWYLLQPPSADALYRRIAPRLEGGSDSWVQAEGDIEQFLLRFPKDSRAAALREKQKEIELYRLERKLERRAKGLAAGETLLPIERAYLEAVNLSRSDPERGIARFQALIDLYDHRADLSGPTGQCLELARRRLQQLCEELGRAKDDLVALVRERLDEADRLRSSQPQRAQAMYWAVVELYGDKQWAVDLVRRARDRLAELSAKESAKESAKKSGKEKDD